MEDTINTYYVNAFRAARSLIVAEGSENLADQLDATSRDFTAIHSRLVEISTLMDNLRRECQDRANEIREDIESRKKLEESPDGKFPFVFHGKSKNMSWGDLADIEDRRDAILAQSEHIESKLLEPEPLTIYKTLDNLNGVELPKEIKIQIVPKLNDLASAFAWYPGDQVHAAGIYIRLENLFIKVPFPDVIDSSQNFARIKTIKCKYESEAQCLENRKFLANKYSSEMRDCLFAHHGDLYTKVGTNFRCPVNPRFGNHKHFKSDVAAIKANDIKPLMMYALSDLASCFIWNNFHHSTDRVVFSDTEICQ